MKRNFAIVIWLAVSLAPLSLTIAEPLNITLTESNKTASFTVDVATSRGTVWAAFEVVSEHNARTYIVGKVSTEVIDNLTRLDGPPQFIEIWQSSTVHLQGKDNYEELRSYAHDLQKQLRNDPRSAQNPTMLLRVSDITRVTELGMRGIVVHADGKHSPPEGRPRPGVPAGGR